MSAAEGVPAPHCRPPYECDACLAKRRALAQLDAVERLLPGLIAVFHPDTPKAERLRIARKMLGGW